MSTKKPAPDVQTSPVCIECGRTLSFMAPQDVAEQLEAVLAETCLRPFPPDLEGQNRRGQENTDKLLTARVRMHHLACHLRRRCVFCAPALPTFKGEPAGEGHQWEPLRRGAWRCSKCNAETRDDDAAPAPACRLSSGPTPI